MEDLGEHGVRTVSGPERGPGGGFGNRRSPPPCSD